MIIIKVIIIKIIISYIHKQKQQAKKTDMHFLV